MQLVAYGAQDVYLTGNPQITFFKVVYRRHLMKFGVKKYPAVLVQVPTTDKQLSLAFHTRNPSHYLFPCYEKKTGASHRYLNKVLMAT